jgi:large subunit ribosomal protein L23
MKRLFLQKKQLKHYQIHLLNKMKNIIIKPILTEKTLALSAKGTFTFAVEIFANKNQIIKAIEEMYSVHVVDVRTIITHGKIKRIGKKMQKIVVNKWKKAIIKLKNGELIDAFQISTDEKKKDK